jgi:serine/threonine protein kinase
MADSFPQNSGNSSFPRGADFGADQPTMDGEVLLFRRYRVLRELGRGGMGVVVLAHDTALEVPVAVKLVPDLVVRDPEAISDLRKEVLRGMALMHPSIVRTHNFEKDDSGAGIVMEYVQGENLHELKIRQPGGCFDSEQILPWIEQLCAVLDYAHSEARIVHRDLKPRNVMIANDGRVKVADFGIAAVLSDSVSRHSMEGHISGTLSYMSPQQAQGKKPSHLDDIHALGATIYDLLTSKPPYFRGAPASIHAQIITVVPPSLAERRAELEIGGRSPIPPHWEAALAACLAKDPAQRPQTAGDLLARLRGSVLPPASGSVLCDAAVAAGAAQATGGSPPSRSSLPLVALIIFALALITGAFATVLFLTRGKAPDIAAMPRATPIPSTPISEPPPPKLPASNPDPMPPPAPPVVAEAAPEPAPTPEPELVVPNRPPVTNTLGMKFVPVAGLNVLVSVWETRVQDYQAFARATGRQWQKPDFKQGPTHPVTMVNWADAKAFCEWLSKKEGRRYRLPTDAEWSLAVGIRSEIDGDPVHKDGVAPGYPWGPAWPPPEKAGNYADASAQKFSTSYGYIDGYDDGFPHTSPVGSFPPNASGLYDLGGNVWEWCEEWLDSEKREERTLRGCSWYDGAEIYMRSSSRYGVHHSYRMDFSGFRCVLE